MSKALERYQASLLLSGCGDAIGFRNGRWEFCKDGRKIHEELEELGGVHNIEVSKEKGWKLSDDTIMHIATAEALIRKSNDLNREALYTEMFERYKQCMEDMDGRAPGETCMSVVYWPKETSWRDIPFNDRGGGCGAAMRAMCIGLRYPNPDQLDDLIAVSIESGRMTHHHPTGYLGALASALFTAYAIQGKPLTSWGKGLIRTLEKAEKYIRTSCRDINKNIDTWKYFKQTWQAYLNLRGIEEEDKLIFPAKFDVPARDNFYTLLSYGGWGGASGHDAPMIAYDAMLASGDDWEELCKRAMFHGGDSDSTGVIAGAWFGALYGFRKVQKINYEQIEYKKRIVEVANDLYQLSHPEGPVDITAKEEMTSKRPFTKVEPDHLDESVICTKRGELTLTKSVNEPTTTAVKDTMMVVGTPADQKTVAPELEGENESAPCTEYTGEAQDSSATETNPNSTCQI